jgi:hypothetical protein
MLRATINLIFLGLKDFLVKRIYVSINIAPSTKRLKDVIIAVISVVFVTTLPKYELTTKNKEEIRTKTSPKISTPNFHINKDYFPFFCISKDE